MIELVLIRFNPDLQSQGIDFYNYLFAKLKLFSRRSRSDAGAGRTIEAILFKTQFDEFRRLDGIDGVLLELPRTSIFLLILSL
jgi:hypothetical protein